MNSVLRQWSVTIATIALLACGGSVEDVSPAANGAPATGPTAPSADAGAAARESPASPASPGSPRDGGASPTSSSGDASSGLLCGTADYASCPTGQYCGYMEGGPEQCNGTAIGVCMPTPVSCPNGGQRVCGCDDETYGNACEAARAGVGVAAERPCWQFACGNKICDARSEYCVRGTSGGCKPLPSSCVGALDASTPCACFPVLDASCTASKAGKDTAYTRAF